MEVVVSESFAELTIKVYTLKEVSLSLDSGVTYIHMMLIHALLTGA